MALKKVLIVLTGDQYNLGFDLELMVWVQNRQHD